MHLATPKVEVDVVVREHSGELLRDTAQLQDRTLVSHAPVILGGGTVPAP
jgi:hypothetical protein